MIIFCSFNQNDLRNRIKNFFKNFQKKIAELKKAVSLRLQILTHRVGSWKKIESRSLTWWKNIYENR